MLVISRQRDESIMIGNDLLLTVLEIRGFKANPRIASSHIMRALILVSRKPSGRHAKMMEEVARTWLECNQAIPLGDDVSCEIVDIQGDKVRLGFMVPSATSIHRKEVYDAIRREQRKADGDDDDTLGSPVPR